MKLIIFCAVKKTVKRWPTKKKIFAAYTSNKRLTSRIQQELKKTKQKDITINN